MADTEYTPDNEVWDNPEVTQIGLSATAEEAAQEAAAQAAAANISYKGAVMQSSPLGYANGDGEQFAPGDEADEAAGADLADEPVSPAKDTDAVYIPSVSTGGNTGPGTTTPPVTPAAFSPSKDN